MTDDLTVRELERRLPVEQFMGWARITGSALAFLQFGLFTHYPPGVREAGLALAGTFTLLGIWTLRRVSRPIGLRGLERMMRATLAVDALLLVAFNLLLAYERDATTRGLMLIAILEGAMKLGRRGSWMVAGSVLFMEAGRVSLRTLVHETNSDIAESIFFFGLSALVAAFAGQMALLARTALAEADANSRDTEVARGDLAGLHGVLLSGLDAITDREAQSRMLKGAAELVGFGHAVFGHVGPGGRIHQLVASDVADPAGVVTEDAAAYRALSEPHGRPIRHVTNDDLVVAVAVPGSDGADGVLMFRDPLGDRRAPDDMLISLAHQTGLVVRVADAFAREQAIAERLQQLDRIKNDFITVASHELRTPLAAISGAAETLVHRRAILSDSEAQQLDRIVLRQSGRLTALVDDLNTVLDIDNGQLRVVPRPTRLLPIVLAAVERSDVAVELVNVEGGSVVADPERLEQVLAQLIGNAAEHAPGARIRLRATYESSDVVISVEDDGPGIDPSDATHIFDRFFQSVDALAHQRGTGLGLPIARELAQAMAGDVVHVPSDTGTTFEVRLPSGVPAEPQQPRRIRLDG